MVIFLLLQLVGELFKSGEFYVSILQEEREKSDAQAISLTLVFSAKLFRPWILTLTN